MHGQQLLQHILVFLPQKLSVRETLDTLLMQFRLISSAVVMNTQEDSWDSTSMRMETQQEMVYLEKKLNLYTHLQKPQLVCPLQFVTYFQ